MKRRISKNSITSRWIINNLGVLLLILLIILASLIFGVQNYYYSSTQQYISSKLNSVTGILNRYATDSTKNFATEVKNIVENFSDKNHMELMAVNSKGNIVLTSSGFSATSTLLEQDYKMAMESEVKTGYWIGRTESGEKVMSVTYSIADLDTDFNAMRIVVSLSEVDNYVFNLIVLVVICCLVVLFLLILTGFYFVSSIVKPIQQISTTAGKFAMGDFSIRIENNSEDEIGDLCRAINHMADELSNTENMKNEFISSVSHELRTPLTAIKGWAETLTEDNDTITMKKGIHVIINETERLSQMVEELLDFSRIQSGKFTLNLSTIDILAELEDALLIYTEKAKRDKIEIIYNAPEMLPFVYGDKNRLRQVFINIIDNALKYNSQNGTITIEASQGENQNKDNIHILIQDTGCGIKEVDLPKIKTKFYKANHTKRGSGIGLAVANEIITMHNGSIDILSKEGVGTTVIITLPIQKSENKDNKITTGG